MSNYPNFLIVGAPKCGTTSLSFYLRQHPDVFLPPDTPGMSTPKTEPHYFIQPKSAMGVGPGKMNGLSKPDSLDDYYKCFSECSDERMIGEASPGYLYLYNNSIKNILNFVGDIKIIIMLRDPVARAFSSHMHHVRNNHDPISFEQALAKEQERDRKNCWFGCQLRGVGMYYTQVRAFLEQFKDVLVLISEDFRHDLNGELRKVYEFLGVSQEHQIESKAEQNVGSVPRIWAAEAFCRRVERKSSVYPIKVGMISGIRKVNNYRPRLNPNTARKLALDFDEDVRKLSDLLGRDLSFWLEKYR